MISQDISQESQKDSQAGFCHGARSPLPWKREDIGSPESQKDRIVELHCRFES